MSERYTGCNPDIIGKAKDARIAELEVLLGDARALLDIASMPDEPEEDQRLLICERIDEALRSTKTEGDVPQSMGD